MLNNLSNLFLKDNSRKSTFLMPMETLQYILGVAYLMLQNNTKIGTIFHFLNILNFNYAIS